MRPPTRRVSSSSGDGDPRSTLLVVVVLRAGAGVDELDDKSKAKLLHEVRSFATFVKGNDPRGEHDFGKVEIEGQNYFWKIDYYNLTFDGGSEDPTSPAVTTRVLTIMRTDEY